MRPCFHRWHRVLGLPQQAPSWYRARLSEELRERRLASTPLTKLSETADVLFCVSRSCYDGFPVRTVPLPSPATFAGRLLSTYILTKYTSRFLFYRTAAGLSDITQYRSVREVVNPSNEKKLEEVAFRHQLDPVSFKRVARLLRRVWPLLP
ncbi:uncharacterized protein PG998_012087 [Apiospora kogelbergensis]|uniref:uncharacterized protein n=1 Tax=Apiospora kogelbergensis TaxID=1337665 RepID=UPI00312E9502